MTGGPATHAQPADLSLAQRVDWLRLIRTDNVGPATFRRLINRFGSAAAALDALPGLTSRGGPSRTPNIPALSEIEDEMAAMEKTGAQMVCMGEAAYPALLRHIHDPPPIVMVHGATEILARDILAIVGSRNASAAGMTLAGRIAKELGENGYAVASGLARGIDAAAHRAALPSGTIAVLAGGLHHIYPPEHLDLADQIVTAGGALISEMPLGWTPKARDFPRRNRLISGLAVGTLIVEAARRSGSLITARFALEQNREVFAAPGSPLDARAEGVNALIREGATLTRNANDIIEQLRQHPPGSQFLFEEAEPPEFDEQIEGATDPQTDQNIHLNVISALSVTPVAVNDLIATTGISTGRVHMILLELELAGRIERSAGGLVGLVG